MQHLNTSSHNSTSWATNRIAPSVVLGLCCVVGIPGNLLVAVAISRHLRTASLMVKLMLNLALTDILSLLMALFWIVGLLGGWPYGDAACNILSFAVLCSLYASVLTVTLMSVHRYQKVLQPSCKVRFHLRESGEKVLLASLWVLACLLAIPATVCRKVEKTSDARQACRPKYNSYPEEATILLLETLLGFLVPAAILTVSYFCIIHRVGRSPFLSKQRLSKLVTWVVMAFFLFWAPWHALNLVQVMAAFADQARQGLETQSRLREIIRQGQNIAGALTFLNSCLNPFLYALASRSLRNSSSVLKRMELVCHSKTPDVPDTDCRKTLRAFLPSDATLARTTELSPWQPESGVSAELSPRSAPDT